MEQVKIFKGQAYYAEELEKEINAWLSEMGNKIEITGRTHSTDNHYTLIAIFYKKTQAPVADY